jgi:GTP-binding protein Era
MKSGIVAVIGKANAGKSTLINVLVGEKISIVSPKPQTTRERILGILNGEDYQIVFSDTPGIYKSTSKLSDFMKIQTEQSAKDVELILFVLDGHNGIEEDDITLIKRYVSTNIPVLVALTKIDIMEKEKVPLLFAQLNEAEVNCEIVPVSARKNKNIKDLLNNILKYMPEGKPIYPDDIISDKSERFMIAEIMREKILLKYDKEIPHGIAIIINEFKKRDTGNLYDINLDIICEKANHKAILIGKQGGALKEVVSYARLDMEKFLGSKVFLTTYVKVKEGWRDKEGLLREFGYEKIK